MINKNWIISLSQLLFVFLATLLLIVYLQFRQRYKYWKQLGVEQLNPIFPVGDLSTSALGLKNIVVRIQELYNQYREKNLKYGGIYFYNGPIFLPSSADLIKRILTTDFEYFIDRGVYINEKELPISAHLFSMKGQQWKTMRTKCSPHFTPAKIKGMFSIFVESTANLLNTLNKYNTGDEFDIKQKITLFTSDTISSAGLGIEHNSLKDPDSKYARTVNKIFDVPRKEFLKLAIEEGLQKPGNILKLMHINKEVTQYFSDMIHSIVEYRIKNNVFRNDLMDSLIKLKQANSITMDEIVAQCYVFFTAGFETSSTTLSFAIHELAHNQQIQNKLREEIVGKLGKDVKEYNYEDVTKLPYLDRVFKEAARKYPAAGIMLRITEKPYKIPDSDITLPAGMPVVIPLLGLHRDPEYFPDPLIFDPERFNSESANTIVTDAYLPFGDGPRYCLGKKFGILQVKLGLAALVANFKFLPGKKSQPNLPFQPSTTSPVLASKYGIPVKIIKL